MNMETLSILSLNYDCLLEILSRLDDFTSFYFFSVTCKRFYQVSLETKHWHINVLKRKIRYYGTRFVINEFPKDRRFTINLPLIQDLISIAEVYKITKPTLANAMNVWWARGPVAAEVFQWILDFKLRQEFKINGEVQRVVKKLTFRLPILNQELIIDTHLSVCSNRVTFKLTFGDLFVLYEIVQNSKTPCSYANLSEEHVRGFAVRAKPIIDILQKELGETVPSITGHFLLWFCFYPDSRKEIISDSMEQLQFKSNYNNREPTQESVQAALDSLNQSESLMRQIGESTNVGILCRMAEYLHGSSKHKVLHSLSKEIFFVLGEPQQLSRAYRLSDLLLCDLVLRVTFLPNTFSENHESDITNFTFRTKGGEILKAEKIGLPRGKFRSIWNFTLPNGQKIHFELEEFARWMDPREYGKVNDPFLKLQPVTEILEECVNSDTDKQDIKLTNIFTEKLFSALLFYKHCDKLYARY
ncbi:uncharacterized protein LOC110235781 [Exaiptasia diaphana]|uniref:F-box domain-containing protein n=1 Tax=Exaiptasia diaphana TaxID=2652724 RepID=A0A913X0V5_EXADI|nr:uncharacterized protein LOC110235781 [Exaiptasia diaphana]